GADVGHELIDRRHLALDQRAQGDARVAVSASAGMSRRTSPSASVPPLAPTTLPYGAPSSSTSGFGPPAFVLGARATGGRSAQASIGTSRAASPPSAQR